MTPTALQLLDACEHCYSSPGIVAGGGRDAASVVRLGGQGVLVFRGTLTPGGSLHADALAFRDWLNDAHDELIWRPEYRGRVHAGWHASLEGLWLRLPRITGSIILAGHSKGGALAQLCGLRLALQGVRVQVVTFGSPKAGDQQFADAFNELCDHDRYVNPRDLVPHLPPLGYAHTGCEIGPSWRWVSPKDVIEAHQLATGYRPWITGQDPPAEATMAA